MKDGRLYINAEIVPREPLAAVQTTDLYGKLRAAPSCRETLPDGRAYTIIKIEGDTGFLSNRPVFDVPADQYFVLGDNRDNSAGSRIPSQQGGVGYVPLNNFVGRVEFVFFSTSHPERMFQSIR